MKFSNGSAPNQNKVKSHKFVITGSKQNPKKIIGTKSTNKNENLI
jgi:hypothetical protein